ncbi:T9SS type A sorting domain-containing protein [Paracrocinitomix mangrovi]|uniref:T9SS type A sorting domain-containing protein n=1 Tax=Paracrocinitomix mangrovi TaxID=2862509 RepID=UPI001C8E0772|nr:T9SS type A sorting domain-containing protein [Paracrocinitomix mangrovi]UKN00754.1 T9SS type A sorting domain-containing protein [Paracrocinitomix mangrovi]
MRKVYLSMLSILSSGLLMAQMTQETKVYELASPADLDQNRPMPVLGANRAPDDIVWSDDFSTTSNWNATYPTTGLDPQFYGWSIGTTTMGWYFGTSGDMGTTGNFARFVNGSPATQSNPNPSDPVYEGGPYTLEYVGTPVDLSSVPAPHLEFEHYGARFITLQAVEVSTDGGTTWIEVGNNNDIAPLTSGGGSVYPKPETRRFNITSAITGNPANVTFRLLWDGAQNGPNMNYVEYGWFVDDIRVVEGHSYDAEILTANFASGAEMLEYYMVPTTQTTGIEFSGKVKNNGAATFTGLHLEATVDMGGNVFTGTSANVDLPSGDIDSMVTTTTFTPAGGMGTYDFQWVFVGDNADTYNSNDILTDAIEVTEYTYARDNGVATGSITNVTSNTGQAMGIGNIFETFGAGVIGAVDINIGSATSGDIIFARIDKWDDGLGEFVYVAQTSDHSLTASQTSGWVKLFLASPVTVAAGDVYLITANHYGGSPEVAFSYAQGTYDGTVIGYVADGSLFSLLDPEAVMVRADMRDFTGVDQFEATFNIGQNVPNPFDNNSIINYTLAEAANVSVQFTDISGKVVKVVEQGSQTAGSYQINVDGNDFAEGVYFYTFTIGDKQVTKRMVVTK